MINSHRVTIEKIVNGGYGLARLISGQVVMVPNTLPEESVIVTSSESKKNYLFGRVKEFEKYHPQRVTPPCQYYTRCGGCDFQHCSYNLQLELKSAILQELLSWQNGMDKKTVITKVAPPVPSPKPFHYRQRIRLKVDTQNRLGFFAFRSHEIIEIDSCLLARPELNQALQLLRALPSGKSLTRLCNEVEILLNPNTGKIVCLFHFQRKPRPADINCVKELCHDTELFEKVFFRGREFPLTGPYPGASSDSNVETFTLNQSLATEDTAEGADDHFVKLSWEPGGFCQVNLEQNRQLIQLVINLIDPKKTESVLDLFCGMGNFAIPLALKSRKVNGVEGQGSAIRSAKRNAELNKLDNTTFVKSPVERACIELVDQSQVFDIIVIDPPRQGIPGLAPLLAKLCKNRLVYISCDPATLSRDICNLAEEGFSVSRIIPVDMFPQTHHLETVVLLKKNG